MALSHHRTEHPHDIAPKENLDVAREPTVSLAGFPEHGLSDAVQSSLFRRELRLTKLIYGFAVSVAVGLLLFAIRADRASTLRAETAARADVQNELAELRSRLESNLTGNMQLVRGLPGLFALNPNLSQSEFERALEPLFEGRSQVRNIAAAPDMVITLMYPIQGNEKAIGLNYRETPAQFEAADRARRLRKLVLAGPVNLVQGGTAFISRIPIFENTASDEQRFWGIVSTVIDAQQLYADSGLLNPDIPVEIAIRGKDGLGASGELFFGNGEIFENSPVLSEIQLPQGTWQMAAVPHGGWTAQPDGIWLQRGIFLLAAAMTVVPLLMLAKTRDLLMQAAARRQEAEDERRKIEQQMLHAQKLESLGVMAGGIAHDFNNILTAIMGYTQLVACAPSIDGPSADFLKNIDSAAERAAELCNHLLAYSGKGQFVIEPIDLSELIRETEALLRVSIPKHTHVQLRLARDIPMIEADASQLRQIVMNLITNAIDAIGGDKGVLTIETGLKAITQQALKQNLAGNECVAGEYVIVKVTDSGCGMDDLILQKVFDPFFTTKATGRGLGMAAVLGIMRSHRGAIFCDTELGIGSSFTAAFQSTDRRAETPAETHTNHEIDTQSTILVVDDEPAIRSVIANALTSFGHTVITAEDGQQGTELFTQHAAAITLSVIDMAMPNIGGMEALSVIRNIQPEARVILISGYSEEDVDTSTDQEQPNAFLQKPFRIDQLVRVINEVLGLGDRQRSRTVASRPMEGDRRGNA